MGAHTNPGYRAGVGFRGDTTGAVETWGALPDRLATPPAGLGAPWFIDVQSHAERPEPGGHHRHGSQLWFLRHPGAVKLRPARCRRWAFSVGQGRDG